MKKHLSKIVLTTLILLAVASSMIFAGILTTVPSVRVEVLYTLGTENPVLAFIVEDAKIAVTDELIKQSVGERIPGATVVVDGTTVTIDGTKYDLVVFGDLNEDGKIDVLDALLVLDAYINKTELAGTDLLRANISNADNSVNVLDALRILELYVGKSTEILAEEYTNNLAITNYTVGADEVVLEFNMNVERDLAIAYDLADTAEKAIVVNDKEGVALGTQPTVTLKENKATLTFTGLANGDYTVEVSDYSDVIAEQAFKYSALTLGDVAIKDQDNASITTTITKANEKLNVSVPFTTTATVTGSFSLVLDVYDNADVSEAAIENGDTKLLQTLTISGATIASSTATFENVDMASLKDGYVVATAKYKAGKYEVEKAFANTIQKLTTELKVASAEIDRADTASDTTITLLLELEEEVSTVPSATVAVEAYDKDTAPETPKAEDITTAATSVEKVGDKAIKVTYTVADTSLQDEEAKHRLFLVLDDSMNKTAVLPYDLPVYGLERILGASEVVLGEDGIAKWQASLLASNIEGYRVYLYDASDDSVVYTETVTATSLDLMEVIRADEPTNGTGYYVKVIALGDGVTYLNAEETADAKSNEITFADLTLGTLSFEVEPANSTKITMTYAYVDKVEEVEKVVADIDHLEISVYNNAAITAENLDGLVETFDAKLPAVEDDEENKKAIYTIDLADKMTANGEWTVKVKAIAKTASLSLDTAETVVTGSYVKASIKDVKTEVTMEEAKVTVEAEGPATTVKVTYLDASGNTVIVNGTVGTPITLDLEAEKEYSLTVELMVSTATVDKKENVKVKLAEKVTLTSETPLVKGTTFIVKTVKDVPTEITIDGSQYYKVEIIENKDILLAVNEMLEDGEEFILDETGVTGITLNVVDDPDADIATRTLELSKDILADRTAIYADSAINTLVLAGTTNDILVSGYVVDIQGLKAGVIDLSAKPVLRLSGTEDYDTVSWNEEDSILAPVTAYTNFKVEGYDHVFRVTDTTISTVALYKGFVELY